jgi:hypothetical protein
MPAFHSDTARSGVSIPPWVSSVTYLSLTAPLTAETIVSRSRRSVGSPPVKVMSIGLKKRAASAKEASSLALAEGSVFQ